jgi:glucan phosphorylase
MGDVKRIHDYKRQLLNALRIGVLYNWLRANPNHQVAPRTFLFAGKAAPDYLGSGHRPRHRLLHRFNPGRIP